MPDVNGLAVFPLFVRKDAVAKLCMSFLSEDPGATLPIFLGKTTRPQIFRLDHMVVGRDDERKIIHGIPPIGGVHSRAPCGSQWVEFTIGTHMATLACSASPSEICPVKFDELADNERSPVSYFQGVRVGLAPTVRGR